MGAIVFLSALGLSHPAQPVAGPEYAEDLGSLSAQARAFDSPRAARYSFCVRNTAIYECLSYDSSGEVRRRRRAATAHGTAFGYRRDGGDTLLLTNQHVAEWPPVTDDDREVSGVPAGCKVVSETLKIVDDENDAYERDDIPLTRVVADPQLDIAVLRAHAALEILPWRVGRSQALRERNIVVVKGYPLGAFAATNVGKVVSVYDHDTYRDWDHDDFVIDALLSPGNSGSPVLAVSARTGEFELVGIYHASYSGGSAMNVVIAIDQVRDLMSTLEVAPRERAATAQLDAASRTALAARLRGEELPFFRLGSLLASVRELPDGALLFQVFSHDFPADDQPLLAVRDAPPGDAPGFGEVQAALFGDKRGLRLYLRADLDAESLAAVERIADALRRDAIDALHLRDARRAAARSASREAFDHAAGLEHGLERALARQTDLAQAAVDLAERLAPHLEDKTQSLADLTAPPAPPAPTAAVPAATR